MTFCTDPARVACDAITKGLVGAGRTTKTKSRCLFIRAHYADVAGIVLATIDIGTFKLRIAFEPKVARAGIGAYCVGTCRV